MAQSSFDLHPAATVTPSRNRIRSAAGSGKLFVLALIVSLLTCLNFALVFVGQNLSDLIGINLEESPPHGERSGQMTLDFFREGNESKMDASGAIALRGFNHKEYEEDAATLAPPTEPTAVILVGPHKTGTTSLQNFLAQNRTRDILLTDAYGVPMKDDLPGRFQKKCGPHLNLAHCLIRNYRDDGGEMGLPRCRTMGSKFHAFTNESLAQGRGIIVVAEDFDRTTIDVTRLRPYLHPYKRIKVLVTYRRLHDWLPSWYRQIVGMYLDNFLKRKTFFPSFVQWVQKQYDNFLEVHAAAVADRYGAHVDDVEIVNFHDGELLENFFCNAIPNAMNTCQSLRNKELHGDVENNQWPSFDLARLSFDASMKGLIGYNLNRRRQVEHIVELVKLRMTHLNITVYDLPHECTSTSLLERIFNASVDTEKRLLPEWFDAQGGERALRREINRAALSKLCSLDTQKVLKDPEWSTFFRGLVQCKKIHKETKKCLMY